MSTPPIAQEILAHAQSMHALGERLKDIAQECGISQTTIRRWVSRGLLPHRRQMASKTRKEH